MYGSVVKVSKYFGLGTSRLWFLSPETSRPSLGTQKPAKKYIFLIIHIAIFSAKVRQIEILVARYALRLLILSTRTHFRRVSEHYVHWLLAKLGHFYRVGQSHFLQ